MIPLSFSGGLSCAQVSTPDPDMLLIAVLSCVLSTLILELCSVLDQIYDLLILYPSCTGTSLMSCTQGCTKYRLNV